MSDTAEQTPWIARKMDCQSYDHLYSHEVVSGRGAEVCSIVTQANADHIVRCVNSHAALVAACRAARDEIAKEAALTGDEWQDVIATLDAALRAAGETP